jgi:hypothetical protein
MDEADPHHARQNDPTISTPRGITIHGRDEVQNALDSIRGVREFDSNEIEQYVPCSNPCK